MAPLKTEPFIPETRCPCGQLLLKRLDSGIEIKCKRCKRIQIVPYGSIKDGNTATLDGLHEHD